MSAPTTPPPTGPPSAGLPTLDVSRTPRVPLLRLVQVEMRKALDTLASFWLVVAIGVLVVMAEGLILVLVLVQDGESTPGDYAIVASYVTALALPVLAIMLVTGEWTQRTAMVTFALEPRRVRVLLAKYLTGVAFTVAAVVLAIVLGIVCAAICEVFLPAQTTWDFQPEVLGGFLVTQVLAMSLGFALACLLLNTPASIVLFGIYRVLPVSAFGIVSANLDWFGDVRPWIDFEYAQGPLYDLSVSGEEWGYLLTAGALWLGVPLALGLWRILRAEVK